LRTAASGRARERAVSDTADDRHFPGTKTQRPNWGTLSSTIVTDKRDARHCRAGGRFIARRRPPAEEEDHMKFVHVAVRTKDLEQAVKFYEQLGMRCARRRELTKGRATLAFMEAEPGGFAIELVYNWGKDGGYESGERFGHFAFETDDIDAVLPVLELFGGIVTRQPYTLEGDGPRLAFVEDPDGNSIELIQR
jgi:lactoylglutathione lyase